jgi:hypothetical protein
MDLRVDWRDRSRSVRQRWTRASVPRAGRCGRSIKETPASPWERTWISRENFDPIRPVRGRSVKGGLAPRDEGRIGSKFSREIHVLSQGEAENFDPIRPSSRGASPPLTDRPRTIPPVDAKIHGFSREIHVLSQGEAGVSLIERPHRPARGTMRALAGRLPVRGRDDKPRRDRPGGPAAAFPTREAPALPVGDDAGARRVTNRQGGGFTRREGRRRAAGPIAPRHQGNPGLSLGKNVDLAREF